MIGSVFGIEREVFFVVPIPKDRGDDEVKELGGDTAHDAIVEELNLPTVVSGFGVCLSSVVGIEILFDGLKMVWLEGFAAKERLETAFDPDADLEPRLGEEQKIEIVGARDDEEDDDEGALGVLDVRIDGHKEDVGHALDAEARKQHGQFIGDHFGDRETALFQEEQNKEPHGSHGLLEVAGNLAIDESVNDEQREDEGGQGDDLEGGFCFLVIKVAGLGVALWEKHFFASENEENKGSQGDAIGNKAHGRKHRAHQPIHDEKRGRGDHEDDTRHQKVFFPGVLGSDFELKIAEELAG